MTRKTIQKQHHVSLCWVVLLALLFVASTTVHAKNTTSTSTTDDCATETTAINSDPDLQQALTDLKNNISSTIQKDFYQFCSIWNRGCTVNLTDYYSESLPSTCTDAGGQLAKQAASLECTGKVLGLPIPGGVKVQFVDIPACVGPSCNLSGGSGGVLPTGVQDTIDQVLEEVGQVVEMGIDDGNCTAVIDSGSSGSAASQPFMVSCAFAILASLLIQC